MLCPLIAHPYLFNAGPPALFIRQIGVGTKVQCKLYSQGATNWGSALTHHPHVHCVLPGAGLSLDGQSWVSCRSGFFLSVRVLSRLFRRLFLERLAALHQSGQLHFYGHLSSLNDPQVLANTLAPLRKKDWAVYAKAPFSRPSAVLEYLSRYTHRVAIRNRRLLSIEDHRVSFKWKDYREREGHQQKVMDLDADEFMRRFLLHTLPRGFHRIRQYGILSNSIRRNCLSTARTVLAQDILPERDQLLVEQAPESGNPSIPGAPFYCPDCKRPMRVLGSFVFGYSRGPPEVLAV